MNKIAKLLSILTCLGCLVFCLFMSIDTQAFKQSFYEKKYTELNTAQSIEMTNEALFDATNTLLDYIKDKRDDISCVQEVKGKLREVFDQRETDHMVDVKNLYLNARTICLTISFIGLLSLFILFYMMKYKGYTFISFLFDMKDGLRQVVLSFIIVIGSLLFYALVDFTRFWTMFHQILFTNDLWLLDPRVSIMINMFPEEFFFAMVMNIAITFIVSFLCTAGLFTVYANKKLKGE